MTLQEIKRKLDTYFGMESHCVNNKLEYRSPTGVLLFSAYIYFNKEYGSWRLSQIEHPITLTDTCLAIGQE